jgi:WD40 repeat protein
LVRSVAFSHELAAASVGFDRQNSTALGYRHWRATANAWGPYSSVRSVSFSHDLLQVVSASTDKRVRLWDAGTGELLQTFNVSCLNSNISFDAHDTYLLTERGSICLEPWTSSSRQFSAAAAQDSGRYCYGFSFSSNMSWITWHGHNVLWLPSEYVPSSSVVATWSVAIGCPLGRVPIIRFLPDNRFLCSTTTPAQ